jgi:predicted dehydrogenase
MGRRNRRDFLGTIAAGAMAMAGTRPAAAAERKLQLGVIGVGWYGMVDARAALKAGGCEVAAICDVDSEHLAQSAEALEKLQGKRPRAFKHYEELLDSRPLDAVIIATPPQWHALQFLAALQRGLDIYCEKPISYDIREGRAMVDAARKSDRVVQVGFQRRQSKAIRAVKEFVASGKAGRIVQAEAQIHYNASPKDPTPKDPPPSLDWNLWCGPGPKIPYSEQVGHFNWRLERTSGHGHLVDWGIHLIDACRVILGLSTPKQVTAAGGLYALAGKITTPDTLNAYFEFEQLPLVWRHRIWGAEEFDPSVSNGIFLYGEKATIFVTDSRWVLVPRGQSKERQEFKVEGDAGGEHMAEFLAAIRSRKQPSCTIEDAYHSTATVQLAMIAYETNSVVRWDAAKEQIPDNPAAAALLKREYRQPWVHPFRG